MSLPWFRCVPSKLLGALAGMPPDAGYVYSIVLLRIYEVGGPTREDVETLHRRTGMPKKRVSDAVRWLVEHDKIELVDGRLDSRTTHDELAHQVALTNNARKGGKARHNPDLISTPEKVEINQRLLSAPAQPEVSDSDRDGDSKIQVASATSSTGVVDLFPEAKKLLKSESDQVLLDKVTDVWNGWAVKHGISQVRFLTGRRGTACRQRLKEITNGHGPIAAFEEVLVKCEESFFVKGSPRNRLNFDQLLEEKFFVKMMENGFKYESEVKGGAWRR